MPNATGSQIGSKWRNSCSTLPNPAAQEMPAAAPSASAAPIPTSSACWAGCRSRCGKGLRRRLRRSALRIGMPPAPHAEHRVPAAGHDAQEAELLVPGEPVPEVEAERRHDEERRTVEDDTLARRPALDLAASLPPHQIDEESDGEKERDPHQHPDCGQGGVLVERDDDERDHSNDQESPERRPVRKEL